VGVVNRLIVARSEGPVSSSECFSYRARSHCSIIYYQYCPEDGFRNPANPMQGKGLNAVLVFFDLKSEESKAAFSEENR